jgi:hypothetical protein
MEASRDQAQSGASNQACKKFLKHKAMKMKLQEFDLEDINHKAWFKAGWNKRIVIADSEDLMVHAVAHVRMSANGQILLCLELPEDLIAVETKIKEESNDGSCTNPVD